MLCLHIIFLSLYCNIINLPSSDFVLTCQGRECTVVINTVKDGSVSSLYCRGLLNLVTLSGAWHIDLKLLITPVVLLLSVSNVSGLSPARMCVHV